MSFSSHFIDRPIAASVISLSIFVFGLVAMFQLPISEYPEVAPPSVIIAAHFPGANPAVIAETVATPLEEQINGVENMLYINSLSSTDGKLTMTVTFAIGTDPDLSQQLVQNRVFQALPRLPDITRQLGVTVTKSSPDLTMVVHLRSPNERYDMLYLRNYASLHIRDQLAKISGIGQVRLFGSGDYAMRVWLNPDKIAEHNMTPDEIVNAIRGQNIQVAAGVVGGPPYNDNIQLQLPINVQGRLQTVEEFEQILIKRDANGAVMRLKDVARIELDAQSYSLRSLLNNQPAVAIPIFAAPGANALDISDNVRATMEQLKQEFPKDLDYSIVYDPTVFVRSSIHSVVITLLEAVALVVFVVILFLQSWRASIIPLLAVPVSIIGTFAFMYLLGYSINVLSLFGLILAVGIVVDDAIVVVENVERNIREGKTPRDATIQAMKEVTSPIIATSLVIASVFIPIAFISGLSGMFYQQFALTIVIATFISTLNSLTLSPALCALLLRSPDTPKDKLSKIIDFLFGWAFNLFNKVFDKSQRNYTKAVHVFTSRKLIMMVIFSMLVGLTVYSFKLVPPGYIPAQDKQYLISFAQLPTGATLDRTENVLRDMADAALAEEGVVSAVQFPGLSVNGFVNTASAGIVFVTLEDFDKRKNPNLSANAIAGRLQEKYNAIPEAFIAIFPPPPVRGLGTTGGFKLQIQDRSDQGYKVLDDVVNQVKQKAYMEPALTQVYSNYNVNVPQLTANLDRTKAVQLGLPVEDVFRTLQIYLGSLYINDFNQFGRTYQVIAQADKDFRSTPQDITRLQVRNSDGKMVPLGAVINVEESFGPEIAMHYNAYRSADLNGSPAPGYSSGQAQEAIVKILEETLPAGMEFEWTELTYQQILAGNAALYIFPLCLFLVFLVLAAQYESLTLPLAIIFIVPMSILSAMIGVFLSGGDNNIFTQISLFLLAGLASKNAILIVEFAHNLEQRGYDTIDAAIEASRLRLRPILMTSFAFILGVLPLVLSSGAGAEMRQAIGIAVFSGMLGVTFFGLIFTPVFYVLFRKIEIYFSKTKTDEQVN
ncbi:MAG: efflux RND transporter permease subunit [Piscirickettsiaceae bacterium]|nr:efflux RND transporter permease subunit [Piscirickettsiaceae bacterium]